MTRRREVLASMAAGAAGALAGCSECGETWASHGLSLAVDEVARSGAGWELAVTATASFSFPKSEDAGVGPFDVALYGAEESLLDFQTVDGIRWGDVPDDQRTETECGDYGSTSVGRRFEVGTLPHFVGPRFVDGGEAEWFEPDSTQGFSGVTAVRYAPATASTASPESADGEVTAGDYEQVALDDLPWPPVDEQAVEETDVLAALEFETELDCTDRGGPAARDDDYGAGISVRWARPVPAGSCKRPFLNSAAYGEPHGRGRLTARIGLHEVPRLRCRDCQHLQYSLSVEPRENRDVSFAEVELVHLAADGSVLERVLVPVED